MSLDDNIKYTDNKMVAIPEYSVWNTRTLECSTIGDTLCTWQRH